MYGLNLALAVPLLLLHLAATCVLRAFRTYSPSRLEELLESCGQPDRAEEIAHHEDRTIRAWEVVEAVAGLGLAAVLAVAARGLSSGTLSVWIAASLVSVAVGRIAAEVIGHVHAETILVRNGPMLDAVRRLLDPVVRLLRGLEARAYQRGREIRPAPRPPSVEVEIDLPHSEPDPTETSPSLELPAATHELFERAVALTQRNVDQVMIPRSNMLLAAVGSEPLALARLFVESGYSRIPLYGENRDDIVGILHAKDLFARLLDAQRPNAIDVRKLARPPLFVPESKNAAELLDELRTQQIQMAIVLDEYGIVAGLVTLEDLLEELVGDIVDEYDVPEEAEPIIDLGDGRYEVNASLEIDDLNSRLNLHVPSSEDYSTVGGFAFSTLGHLPEPGTTFERDGIRFTVLNIEGHSIRRLQVELPPPGSANGQAAQ